ncbi:MAG: ATPase, T2SS/T4P/T4SS family [Myxococcota bacterium]
MGVLFAPPSLHDVLDCALRGPRPGTAFRDCATTLGRYLEGPHTGGGLASYLLNCATQLCASDVHLEPEPDGVSIRLRVDGELRLLHTIPQTSARSCVATLKARAHCLPYRSDIVQEGRIPRDGVAADVRASFLPTAFGERAALRLFGKLLSLDQLGFHVDVLRSLEQALRSRRGLILVAGASGAGKTTTLYALLAAVTAIRPGAHLSVEDPVEQRLKRAGIPVDQVELDPLRGVTGETTLVAALRQDVDVLCVGEIRTGAEAALAVQAAHTGRLVLAGVHAGSAEEARQRMLDLGTERHLLSRTLTAVLHQALSTETCPCEAAPACARCQGRGRLRRATGTLMSFNDGPSGVHA